MTVAVLILTYQNRDHLEDLLPSVAKAAEKLSVQLDVLVVENGRKQDTEVLVREQFPQFRHVFAEKNEYLFSLNQIVEELDCDYVCILNDDMAIEQFGLDEAVTLLDENPELFGVNLRTTDWGGEEEQWSVRDLSYAKGYYESQWRHDLKDKLCYTLYPGGGSGVFRKSMFVELGGLCRLYYPAYSEDMDLGWRAWHRGWPSVYLPDSWIRHKEGGSWEDRLGDQKRARQIYTNRMVCMLRNSSVRGFLTSFLIRLPYRFIYGLRGRGDYAVALGRVLGSLGEVLRVRSRDPEPVISDEEIVNRLGTEFLPGRAVSNLKEEMSGGIKEAS